MYESYLEVAHFSARERLLMRLMMLRPPRNTFPDNDRDVVVSGTASSTTVVCQRIL